MIARVLTASTFVLGLASFAVAQEAATARTGAAATNAAATAGAAALAPAARAIDAVHVDPNEYRIGPEDVLEINVWKNEDLSRERVPVRPDGKISHPLVNDIAVAGLTTNQLRAELTERLSKFIDPVPEVSVSVREVHSFKVSVAGHVRMPGQFEIKTSDQTVFDLIAKAQGFDEFADKGSIRLIRQENGESKVIKLDWNGITSADPQKNPVVRPGDKIVVN